MITSILKTKKEAEEQLRETHLQTKAEGGAVWPVLIIQEENHEPRSAGGL